MFRSLFLSLSLLLVTSSVEAQSCPSYARSDREAVRSVLLDVQGYLGRQRELAYLTSFGEPIVSLGLLTQRAALANEYAALLQEIENRSVNPGPRIHPRSARFLRLVLGGLEIEGTTLTGRSQSEAEANSSAANAAVSDALMKLWSCF